ncbi:hypothetical protein J2R73_008800 [Bradyrhizobium japonicum]|nr:hypothetical protein [Bradyrhizobium japonicum]MCP1863796.1 hypothetical protein [Bradyrhizobium japonicum]MCP1963467.1 hypothetical protein [Bradyrhizobium japonicum]MCW2327767.1 hypothetical protein [Bradyrhizobium japonicum]
MIVNFLDAIGVLGGNDRRAPSLTGRDEAVQMHDPSAASHPETDGPPVGGFHSTHNALANVLIVSRRVRDFVRETCHRLQEIVSRHDPNRTLAAHHGKSLNVVLLHQSDDLRQGRLLLDSDDLPRHDVLDFSAALVNELRGRPPWSHEKFQPGRVAASSSDLAAAEKIALRDDADEIASIVDDRQPTDMHLKHDLRGFFDCRVRRYGDDVSRHDMNCVHFVPSESR